MCFVWRIMERCGWLWSDMLNGIVLRESRVEESKVIEYKDLEGGGYKIRQDENKYKDN